MFSLLWLGAVPLGVLGYFLLRNFLSGARSLLRERLDGKLVIVTGCNTGIGFETVGELARRGARVIMACRDFSRCCDARTKLLRLYGVGTVNATSVNIACSYMKSILTPITPEQLICEELNLASVDSIQKFASRILERERVIDILINNAGVKSDDKHAETLDGFELHMGVNHLGHFLLTSLLRSGLRASGSGRVINVSSMNHYFSKMDTNNLFKAARGSAYSLSKLANVIHARELSRRWADDKIVAVSLHPGLVMTDLFRQDTLINYIVRYVLSCVIKTPWEGAQTTVFCALVPNLVPGAYYSNCRQCQPSEQSMNEELGEFVWHTSEKLLQLDS